MIVPEPVGYVEGFGDGELMERSARSGLNDRTQFVGCGHWSFPSSLRSERGVGTGGAEGVPYELYW